MGQKRTSSLFSTLLRPYKERPPDETIDKIRGILKTHGLSPEVTFNANLFPGVYSVVLGLPPNKGGYSTNGKGRTKELCLASAYAEFIERMQNGMYVYLSRTLQAQIYHEFGIYYDPRERFLTRDEFENLPEEISNDLTRYKGQSKKSFINSYYKRIASNKMEGVVAVPFFCSRTKKNEYIPLNLLLMMVGSNGMAAGNSYEEALFQALCEIMERWAGALIFYNRLTPPTIPDTYLNQFSKERDVISNIQKNGKYKVVIKDFSAGMKLPVVGIIVINVLENTYRLNIGCDTSFQVALNRCLTEVFQGFENEQDLDRLMLKIPEEDPPYFRDDTENDLDVRYEIFSNFCVNNTGAFPISLFGKKPSYSFNPTVFASKGSYKEEVKKILDFIYSLGYSVYVRDVSYMGFPSLHVYLPGISSLGKKNAPVTKFTPANGMIEADKLESRIVGINYNSRESCSKLIKNLSALPAYTFIKDLVGIELDEGCPGSKINVSFLLSQLLYRIGKLKEAAEALMVFQEGNCDNVEYYYAMGSYMEFLASGKKKGEVRKKIIKKLGQTEAVLKACHDIEFHKEFFNRIPLPKCPDCSKCLLSNDCITRRLMEISRILYPIMKNAYAKM